MAAAHLPGAHARLCPCRVLCLYPIGGQFLYRDRSERGLQVQPYRDFVILEALATHLIGLCCQPRIEELPRRHGRGIQHGAPVAIVQRVPLFALGFLFGSVGADGDILSLASRGIVSANPHEVRGLAIVRGAFHYSHGLYPDLRCSGNVYQMCTDYPQTPDISRYSDSGNSAQFRPVSLSP